MPAITPTTTTNTPNYPQPSTTPRDPECGIDNITVTNHTTDVQIYQSFRNCGFLSSASLPLVDPIYLLSAKKYVQNHFYERTKIGSTSTNRSMTNRKSGVFPLIGFRERSDRADYFPPMKKPFDATLFAALLPSFWHHLYTIFGTDGCCALAFFTVLTNGPTKRKEHQDYHSDLIPSASNPSEQIYVNIDLNNYDSGGLEIIGGCFGKSVDNTHAQNELFGKKNLQQKRQQRCGSECYEFVERTGGAPAIHQAQSKHGLHVQCARKFGWYRKGRHGSWTMYTPSTLHRGRAAIKKRRFVLVFDVVKKRSSYHSLIESYFTQQQARTELTELEQRRVLFAEYLDAWIHAGKPKT
jgi:hypothetical protein